MNERLRRLAEIGQGVWMDSLSRDDIENGNLGEMIEGGAWDSPIEEGLEEARALIGELREAGVDYEEVTEVLEKEGVQKFADSFDELMEMIQSKSRQVVRQG